MKKGTPVAVAVVPFRKAFPAGRKEHPVLMDHFPEGGKDRFSFFPFKVEAVADSSGVLVPGSAQGGECFGNPLPGVGTGFERGRNDLRYKRMKDAQDFSPFFGIIIESRDDGIKSQNGRNALSGEFL